LQAVLSLGDLGDKDVEDRLADLVRRHVDQPFLLDAFLSGLMGREAPLLSRLHERTSNAPAETAANRLLTGLARGVLGSREVGTLTKVVAMAGEAAQKGDARKAAALLQGLVPVAGASRRPIVFDAAPEA